MKNYLETIYNVNERPITQYPDHLAKYLFRRYNMKSGQRLVDVGCGRGDFLFAFRREGLDAVGVDISDGLAKQGQQIIYGGIDFEGNSLPFADNSVDIIFSKSVLEHLHNPSNMLNECYRVLKSGGRIILMVPDWHSCMHIYYDDFTHVQPYTETGLRDALKIFQFQQVKSEKFYQLPVVWKHPQLKLVCKLLQVIPVKKVNKNKFYRFSRELILLGSGVK